MNEQKIYLIHVSFEKICAIYIDLQVEGIS